MPSEADSRRNRAHCRHHFMGGYCGTRSRRHTEGQGSGGRSEAEEEREPEKESKIHADEERSRHPEGKGLRHIPGQEETGRSDTMKAVTPQTSAPTLAAEMQMECEGVGQKK